jgi:hypothetical protein
MPARKGMPGARAQSAKKTTKEQTKAAVKTGAKTGPGVNKYMPNQGHGSHANMAATQGSQKLLKKASLLQTLLSRKESAETRIRLAEIWIDLGLSKNLASAKECLETCVKKDPADAMCARRVLVPLLLNLGEHAEATALLEKYSDDTSALMLCSGLLLALATHSEAESKEEEAETAARAQAAFERLFECNWQACALLAATANGESPIAEQTVLELREARIEKLAKGGTWPGRGGVSEAILLSEVFSGCAGVRSEEDNSHEDAWPGLEGVAIWLSAATLDKYAEGPPTKPSSMPSDEKKVVRVMEGVLGEVFEELQNIVLEASQMAEEGEEGEGEEDEGEEEGEEEEEEAEEAEEAEEEEEAEAEKSSAAAASSSTASPAKRSRSDFEAWKAAKCAKLAEKLARMPPGGAVSDEEGSDEEE